MKRKRRAPTPNQASSLRVEKDAATGVVTPAPRSSPPRYSRLELPHERDESTQNPGPPSEVTRQAARDVESGKIETDCYAATGARFDRKQRERR